MAPWCRTVYIILSLWFFSFFFYAKFLRPLNGSQPILDTYPVFTYDCYLKNLVGTPSGIYSHGLRDKKLFFGTDFELWPNISQQQNMISTIRKKLVNLPALSTCPKLGELWSRNGWERLASFFPPPKFLHSETLPALPHGHYITDSRQTLAHVM